MCQFDDAYQIEMYFENVEGYEGEKEIMTKFGLEMRDEATFIVAKRRFATWKERGAPLWYTTMTQNQNGTMIGCSGN